MLPVIAKLSEPTWKPIWYSAASEYDLYVPSSSKELEDVAQQHYRDEARRQKSGDSDIYRLLELLEFLMNAKAKTLKGQLERQLVMSDIRGLNLKDEIQAYWSDYGKHQN